MHEELRDLFEKRARGGDGAFAIAWAILDLSDSQEAAAKALKKLGNGDASTHIGAIESLGMQIEKVADAISSIDLSLLSPEE